MGASLKERLTEEYIAPSPKGDVYLYRVGVLSMSVCAPKSMTRDEVAAAINSHYPCGTERGWLVSEDKTFKDGEPMPNQCEETAERQHWFIEC